MTTMATTGAGSGTPNTTRRGGLGKVTAISGGMIHFTPAGTNYTLHLIAPNFVGAVGAPVRGMVRVTARKIWTVPSGGNFIAPISGPPRIIQGRVRVIEPRHLIVHGGTEIWVDLPDDDTALAMADGALAVGHMVNVTAQPGATFEPA